MKYAKIAMLAAAIVISPASGTNTTGDVFTASINIAAEGSKICAVQGAIAFNNLSCQSITLPEDVMAQILPTCQKPEFLIGIPGCTVSDKTLFTLTAKTAATGPASIDFSEVDILGEGASLGSSAQGGTYTVNPVPVPQISQPTTQTPIIATVPRQDTSPSQTEETQNTQNTENTETQNLPAVEIQIAGLAEAAATGSSAADSSASRNWIVGVIALAILAFLFWNKPILALTKSIFHKNQPPIG